ncbi:MAG: hypothetical protein EZS28_029178 [Streblomastix strix]|uniref:Uncharacterized protein n=1 Tax=Streblomastix strix TaxID=222440 RepID=A0A5J4UZU9_9EUKA|nr:MAG: hypothetical protein EZS28_029178 [Streblomastix strix]
MFFVAAPARGGAPTLVLVKKPDRVNIIDVILLSILMTLAVNWVHVFRMNFFQLFLSGTILGVVLIRQGLRLMRVFEEKIVFTESGLCAWKKQILFSYQYGSLNWKDVSEVFIHEAIWKNEILFYVGLRTRNSGAVFRIFQHVRCQLPNLICAFRLLQHEFTQFQLKNGSVTSKLSAVENEEDEENMN